MGRLYIDKDPFWFINELHSKMHEGYEPTQEDIDEVVRLINIIADALRPVIMEWIEAMEHFVRYIQENLEYLSPEVQEKLEVYGKPIVTAEAGVEQEPEPEEPMPHPHTTWGTNYVFSYIPPGYRSSWIDQEPAPFPTFPSVGDTTTIDLSLDRGTES